MADFTTADLEGVNKLLNKTLTDALALKDSLLAQHGGDATDILNAVKDKVTDLKSSLSSMIPELPTIPNANMQGEFSTLVNLDLNTPAGVEQYKLQVSNIQSQFGTAMADKGLDIDSLATQIQSGVGDVGDLLPNLQIPDGLTIPIELPANVSLPSKESVAETISKTSKDTVTLVTKEIEVTTDEVSGMTLVTTTSEETTTTTTETTTTTSPKTVTDTSTGKLIRVSDTGGPAVSTDVPPSLLATRKKNLAEDIKERTLILGTYIDTDGIVKTLQTLRDKKIYYLEDRVNGRTKRERSPTSGEYKTRYLSKRATLKFFQSDTYDKDIKDGIDEDEAFHNARFTGDWNWKLDDSDDEYEIYDARYKKLRLT